MGTERHNYSRVFRDIGSRYRAIRLAKGMVQEDVLDYGFSVRHYQQLEAGRPHSITTLLRIAKMFGVRPGEIIDQAAPLGPKKHPRRTAK